MWYKIKQGRHRAYPLSLGIHFGKTKESYEVMFDDSCRYTLDDYNQENWNKLVGWSYGMHHKNSIRIVWRYNILADQIEVASYYYNHGVRIMYDYGVLLDLNTKYTMELKVDSGVSFSIGGFVREYELFDYYPTWGYNLGLYFGGSKSQPNKEDMKVWIKKLKKS